MISDTKTKHRVINKYVVETRACENNHNYIIYTLGRSKSRVNALLFWSSTNILNPQGQGGQIGQTVYYSRSCLQCLQRGVVNKQPRTRAYITLALSRVLVLRKYLTIRNSR